MEPQPYSCGPRIDERQVKALHDARSAFERLLSAIMRDGIDSTDALVCAPALHNALTNLHCVSHDRNKRAKTQQ
jgi:hypothetical protein